MTSRLRRVVWVILAGVVLDIGDARPTAASRGRGFEVWAIDQSVDAGTLYIYAGDDMDQHADQAIPEVIDLNLTATPLCVAQTGTAPVRAHMLGLNSTHTHAILSYVATGHVVFFDTATRQPLTCCLFRPS